MLPAPDYGACLMAEITINLADQKALSADLKRYAQHDQQKFMRKAAEQAGVTLDDFVKDRLPPPVRRLKVASHWTKKQRGWWWATMAAKADGRSNALPGWRARWRKVRGVKTLVISGGYKRTGLMVRALDFDVEQTAAVTTVRYGTNIKHAKWVIDLDNQSKYHAGNWPTLQVLAQQAAPLVRQTFADEMFALTRDGLKE
jgi:hypothetical protein